MYTLDELSDRLEILINKRDKEIKKFGQAHLKVLNQISRTRQMIRIKEEEEQDGRS